MSKLPKAPLVEVVIELRWQITNKDELAGIQYLYGDIYNELKGKYPYRESILPVEFPMEMTINQPVHRFRTEKGGYPLVQAGPGILTLNTINSIYFWDTLYNDAGELIEKFFNVYTLNSHFTQECYISIFSHSILKSKMYIHLLMKDLTSPLGNLFLKLRNSQLILIWDLLTVSN